MGSKKISELTTGSINPPLSAVIPVVYSGETFQQELTTLRNVLVDSGSHVFTGDQTFNGNIEVNGHVNQTFNIPEIGSDIKFIKINNATIDGDEYKNVDFKFSNLSTSQFGTLLENSFIFDYLSDETGSYGSRFSINGKFLDYSLRSTINNRLGRLIVGQYESGSTFIALASDEIRIGCHPSSCSSGITIGNTNASFIKQSSQKNIIDGNTEITGSLRVTGSINLNGEDISNIGGSTSLPYLELTNDAFIFNPYDGEPVVFTKTDFGDEIDVIDTNLAITSNIDQGIYNPFFETHWDDTDNDGSSPINTLWNNEGWADLTNLSQRTYYRFYDVFKGQIGNNITNVELIMKDVSNNKYYKFYFTVWGQSWIGAPVTYTRQQVDGTTGEPIGGEVQFVKLGYEDPTLVNDPIDINLTIARGNNQGIYNIALENSWNDQGDLFNSPEGTLWNSDGWLNLRSVPQRSFYTFYEAIGRVLEPEFVIGKELIMHDIFNDKYYTVKFTEWTGNSDGGGFTYTRQLLNTSDVFVKPDNDTDTIDIFIENDGDGSGIGITRNINGGIYNPYREDYWESSVSPSGTLWNIDGWDDLTNLSERIFVPFYSVFGGNLGNKVPGTECVMYIPEIQKYYAIKFISWTQGGGGGFTYIRYEIDTTKLNMGIKFPDGSILKSSKGIGKVKAEFTGNRRIEEITGYIQVDFTEAVYSPSVESIVYQDNNGNFDFYVYDTPELNELYENRDTYTRIEFSFDNQNTWREIVLSGGSTGFWRQIYFPVNDPQNYVTVTSGQTLYYRVVVGAEPVRWFNAESYNFRGAVIDFHAFSQNAGTIIGTIHIANDSGNNLITHTETKSGSSDLVNIDMWYRNPNGSEREIWFRRLDGLSDTLKIQWIAKMFYGDEYWD